MIFRFGAYEVDLMRQELRRAGALVPVEPQVFDVLAYLLRHRDRIVGKDELFESVSDAALNSWISAARRAIDDDGNTQALIRTAHKRGFRFVGDVHVDHAEPPAEAKGASPKAMSARTQRLLLPQLNRPNRSSFPISHQSRSCRFKT